MAKRTRNLKQTRNEILNVSFQEIYTRGFQGVSIDDIVKKTSLTKGAFYHQFPTKLSLGYALVDEMIKPMTYSRWIEPLAEYDNPLDGILKQIHLLIGKAKPEELQFGCPLNNLVQEMAPVDSIFKEKLEASLTYWIQGMSKELTRAQKAGYLKESVNTKEAAHFIVMAHEGFYGLLKGLNSKRSYKALYNSLKIYFDAIRKDEQ